MVAVQAIDGGSPSLPSSNDHTDIVVQRPLSELPLSHAANQLQRESRQAVNERLQIGSIKLPKPITLSFGLDAKVSSASFSFNNSTREGVVLLNPKLLEEMARLEARVPGLGRAVLESLIVNEYHGIIVLGLAKPGELVGAASKTLEKGSNLASINYLYVFHSGHAYTQAAIDVWNRGNKDIQAGIGDYQGRSNGTARHAELSQKALESMGLTGQR
jgi:hypothetical protein